jgi:hypothetical protein
MPLALIYFIFFLLKAAAAFWIAGMYIKRRMSLERHWKESEQVQEENPPSRVQLDAYLRLDETRRKLMNVFVRDLLLIIGPCLLVISLVSLHYQLMKPGSCLT